MPGKRLDYAERERIASGLSAGQGYAEIARALGRPTSTVTREVARGGGPAAYRADHAHLTSKRSASRIPRFPRNTDAASRSLRSGGSNDLRAGARLQEFEQRCERMMIDSGLGRMPSRVLVCLLTSADGSLYASELTERLQVSPASVSRAVDGLTKAGIVQRERDHNRGRERYTLAPDVWHRGAQREAEICLEWAGTARAGAELLADTPAGARLGAMADFFDAMGADLTRLVERLWGGGDGASKDQ